MAQIWGALNGFTQFSAVLISSIGLLFHLKWSRRSTALGPTILTTLGIFFCFAGIAWGLLDFNPNDVRTSVPHLLQGIRTSFWSSVVGIFWALTLKIRVALFGDATIPASAAQAGSTVDDLARLLVQLNRSIAGSDDSALLSQLKLSRADSAARLDRLTAAFDRYAENIVEANSQALVSALSEVVRDFNAKINVQFGDNFVHLNSAVERLVAWQDQYERQLHALIEQETATRESLTTATASFTQAAASFTDIVNMTGQFAALARSLQNIAGVLNNQSEKLARAVLDLAGLIGEVAEELPILEQRIGHLLARGAEHGGQNQERLGPGPRHPAEPRKATRA
jgi:ABC-type transporter Mla subunit MlaD